MFRLNKKFQIISELFWKNKIRTNDSDYILSPKSKGLKIKRSYWKGERTKDPQMYSIVIIVVLCCPFCLCAFRSPASHAIDDDIFDSIVTDYKSLIEFTRLKFLDRNGRQ